MVSVQHAGLVALFNNRPQFAAEMLRDTLGVTLPAWSRARTDSSDLTQPLPVERHADLVVVLEGEGKPVLAIVVEVQLSRDEDKRMSWPQYLTNLHARLKCPTTLLVVAPDEAVARWCARPLEPVLGHRIQPLVLGPQAVPVVTDEQVAQRCPELAVLSVMTHGRSEAGLAIARVALSAASRLAGERAVLYADLTYSALNDAARSAFEALMQSGTYQYQSEFGRKYVEGIKQARQETALETEAEAVLEVLEARGLEVEAQDRERIVSCTDLGQLKRWLRKAAIVPCVQDLFEPESGSRAPMPTPERQSQHS